MTDLDPFRAIMTTMSKPEIDAVREWLKGRCGSKVGRALA
jgi:hypothetical protein